MLAFARQQSERMGRRPRTLGLHRSAGYQFAIIVAITPHR